MATDRVVEVLGLLTTADLIAEMPPEPYQAVSS
jgi:hypothetical protein